MNLHSTCSGQPPTVVFGSYKGGCGRLALSVAVAERLAMAGLRVLFCDDRPARGRAFPSGVSPDSPQIARRDYGPAMLPSRCAPKPNDRAALSSRPRCGLGVGPHDIAIVDTPPEEHGGHFAGVLLIAITDGTDAARNLTMLQGTPDNTDIMLVRVEAPKGRSGARDAHTIEKRPVGKWTFGRPFAEVRSHQRGRPRQWRIDLSLRRTA